ncbi:vitelline membrane protein Vm26Ab-like [Calliphora vicina]|uniref:vitelline membrane protein Vm26Ab-like n=1 Tax=Calliphora vicina TaxID=7373 RepID=UPI00325AC0C2
MFKFFALCLFAVVALAAAKPGIVAPLAYSAPVVAAAPYTAAYTAPYTAAYTAPYAAAYSAYSAYPYAASPYVASPYTAAYSAYPYAASYVLRK